MSIWFICRLLLEARVLTYQTNEADKGGGVLVDN